MIVDSLEELGAAFSEWRRKKRHPREPMPAGLVKRARRSASVHGVGRVARAVKIDSCHLREVPGDAKREDDFCSASPPSYSRIELVAPTATAHPVAELEMPNGIKLRLYAQTQEVLSLLSSVCVVGGGR